MLGRFGRFPWLTCLLLVLGLALAACRQAELLLPTPTPPPPTPTRLPTPTPVDLYSPTGFDTFLARLDGKLLSERPPETNLYWANIRTTPLLDATRAVFLWRGEARRIALAGDMNNWNPDDEAWAFTRIAGTDLWWLSAEFEPTARLDYKIVLNGFDWRIDPYNPRQMMGGFGANSELAMPAYVDPPELIPGDTPVPQGTVTQHVLESVYLGHRRTFFVYTPPGQLIGAKTPSVYIHDGGDYINIINTPAILDRLIADRRIPPVVAVFVPPIERNEEYNRGADYTAFVTDELVPFIRATYDTDPDPARTATLGASMGGLIAVHLGVTHPDLFGLVAGQSGAYMLDNNGIIRDIAGMDVLPVRLHLLAGTYETAVGGSAEGNILEATRRLSGVLDSFGYDYAYVEVPQGHSWGLWRGYLGDALQFLFES